ncbi:MAG: SDR family oxidoreductase [SAR324 cluster bacterium]|nr:SDR family oxidoreductase [SAR324 cluster bacterium]
MKQKLAVVTGGNRGIGLETCRQLSLQGIQVILTSRDSQKGQKEADKLNVDYHPLDITIPASAQALKHYIQNKYKTLDILVNNAGAIFDHSKDSSTGIPFLSADPQTIRQSFENNTLGAFHVSQALVPLMLEQGYGRIVNVSTGMASLEDMNGGWYGYRMSKTALNALTRIMHDELQGKGIKVNAVCPGWVKTDMGGSNATRTVDKGAETIVWLATLPESGPSGGFFRDKKPIAW